MNQDLIVILVTLGIILIFSLVLIGYLNKQNAPIRTTALQLGGSTTFLLIAFMLAYLDKIDAQTIATLLGAYVGYVFGKISSKGEWSKK